MRALGIAALAAIAILPFDLWAQQVPPPARPRVAVLPFHSFSITRGGVAREVGSEAWLRVTVELNKKPDVEVLDRARIETLVTQRELQAEVLSDEAAARAGQLLGADYVVAGNVYLDPLTARLDVRLVDVDAGRAIRSPVKKSGAHDQLSDLVAQLASEFAREISFDRSAGNSEVEVPADASVAYTRALDYERRGRRDLAVTLYTRALELFPRHAQARAALDRLRRNGTAP